MISDHAVQTSVALSLAITLFMTTWQQKCVIVWTVTTGPLSFPTTLIGQSPNVIKCIQMHNCTIAHLGTVHIPVPTTYMLYMINICYTPFTNAHCL